MKPPFLSPFLRPFVQQVIGGWTPPPILYHYTSQRGLLGIVKSRAVWATSVRFLNDEKESFIAMELVQEKLKALVDLHDPNTPSALMARRCLDAMADVPLMNCFVASFSTHKDQLSQWRGYCPSASGYSIGFDTGSLLQFLQGKDAALSRCIYDVELQQYLVHQLVDGLALYQRDLVASGASDEEASRAVRDEFLWAMMFLAPILKHASFAEEDEWRIVLHHVPIPSPGVQFRPGKSMLAPYVEVPVGDEGATYELADLIVGPTPHPASAVHSVRALLAQERVTSRRVCTSDVPFRDW